MRHVPRSVFFALTATVSVALMGSVSRAENVATPESGVTGQYYLAMSANERASYILGLTDGVFSAPLFGASEARVHAVQQCLMLQGNNVQTGAILWQYIQARPQRWREPAYWFFYSLLFDLCPGVKPE